MYTVIAFLFLAASFLSLWVRRELWGVLLGGSALFGLMAGHIHPIGLITPAALLLLWIFYTRKASVILFLLLICLSAALKLRFLPGYTPYHFTPKFAIGLEGPLIGLFPLAFVVPLAHSPRDWMHVLKGLLIGCIGIAALAALALLSGAVHWQFQLPNFPLARVFSNLLLTSMPEEAFYRGFIQSTLVQHIGKVPALLITSVLFTAAHVYWSPSLAISLFIFLASLLYGTVYLISGKIESAILCHFLLNFTHMTCFSYHAI